MKLLQLSLRADYDPAAHIRAGELLAPLRDEGVLIIGSGLSYHDLRGMMSGAGAEASAVFDQWLNETLVEVSPDERRARLLRWQAAPSARAAHPREDHLMPLLVAAGAAAGMPAPGSITSRTLWAPSRFPATASAPLSSRRLRNRSKRPPDLHALLPTLQKPPDVCE